jgi:hypothetical protein
MSGHHQNVPLSKRSPYTQLAVKIVMRIKKRLQQRAEGGGGGGGGGQVNGSACVDLEKNLDEVRGALKAEGIGAVSTITLFCNMCSLVKCLQN